MATEKAAAANRANSKRSTGAVTSCDRVAPRLNARVGEFLAAHLLKSKKQLATGGNFLPKRVITVITPPLEPAPVLDVEIATSVIC